MLCTRITKKGQMTIPLELREKMGIKTGDLLLVSPTTGGIMVKKPKDTLMSAFGSWKEDGEKISQAIRELRESWNAKKMPRL